MGPLYTMTREEPLLILQTLSELTGKSWILASSWPGEAPVLFLKKPGGDLTFYADSHALNAINERDWCPLPFICENLRLIARAKWISKVDVHSVFHRLGVVKGDERKAIVSGCFVWRLASWLVPVIYIPKYMLYLRSLTLGGPISSEVAGSLRGTHSNSG